MAWVATAAITGIVGVTAGIVNAALAPGAPDAPNLAAANRAGVENDARLLPDKRRLEMAAQLGQKVDYEVAPHEQQVQQQMVRMSDPQNPRHSIEVPYVAEEWKPGGKYNPTGNRPTPNIFTRTVTKSVGGTRTADFTGYGTADVQSRLARKMADVQLELSKKYGTQFVEEAVKQLKESDPEGWAAREELHKQIQDQIAAKPDRPVAELLDKQIGEQVKAGAGLTGEEDARLKEAVLRASVARGQSADGGDFEKPITEGFSGERRLQEAVQRGNAWLASGSTPEDIAYRREQQNLSNLSSFVQGTTPQAQFRNLSGAQTGAAPQVNGTPLPQANPNAGPQAAQAAVTGYQARVNSQINQANPWMAGLSTLISGANTLAAARANNTARTN